MTKQLPTKEQDPQVVETKNGDKTIPQFPENNVGPDTTGVGQSDSQVIQQGNSLPATKMPVEKKFEKEQFYDPMDTERAIERRDRALRGGQKTDV